MYDSGSTVRLAALDQFIQGNLSGDHYHIVERWISKRPEWQQTVDTLRSLDMATGGHPEGETLRGYAEKDWARISEMADSMALRQEARKVGLERAQARPYIFRNYLDVKLRRHRARTRVPKDPGDILIRAERIRKAILIALIVGITMLMVCFFKDYFINTTANMPVNLSGVQDEHEVLTDQVSSDPQA